MNRFSIFVSCAALLSVLATIGGITIAGAQSNAPVGGGGTCVVSTAFDGSTGQQQAYNNGLYFCSSGTWVAQSLIVGPSTATCASALAGMMRFTSTTNTWEFCNGSAWTPFSRTPGYFVQTATHWNGNLGGLSGADAKCLTELQTTYNWKGKSAAGTLSASRVKAFLCDSTTCNNLLANTPYVIAVANSTTKGGVMFMTDASGQGPDSRSYWDEDAMDSSVNTWSNHATISTSLWGTTPQAATNNCTNWSTGAAGVNGWEGNAGWNNGKRWNEALDSCNMTYPLYCFVNPP